MTDRQPADEVFHSCLVDPDLSVAGVPVYALATLCFEHLCLRAKLVLDSFYSNSATRQIRNSGRKLFSARLCAPCQSRLERETAHQKFAEGKLDQSLIGEAEEEATE